MTDPPQNADVVEGPSTWYVGLYAAAEENGHAEVALARRDETDGRTVLFHVTPSNARKLAVLLQEYAQQVEVRNLALHEEYLANLMRRGHEDKVRRRNEAVD